MDVCAESGLLPIEGLCDACVITEWFAEGTEPQYYCDLHYAGYLCAYDNKIASPHCPFAYEGAVEMVPPEDEALWQGSHTLDSTLDPLAAGEQAPVNTTGHCQHDEAFFSQPNWEEIYQRQYNELASRK